MIISYIKLAVRLLLRSPFFTVLNVFGLAIGFASFFGLWNYALNELKSDQYHRDYEQIARLVLDWRWSDDSNKLGQMTIQASPSPTLSRLLQDHPEVKDWVRFQKQLVHLSLPTDPSQYFQEGGAIYADHNLFKFFTIPLVKGRAERLLAEPNCIVLSETMATKYFGSADPLNKTLVIDGKQPVKVTGVFRNLPHNTHLEFDLVLSNQHLLNSWNSEISIWSHNYVKLENRDLSSFEKSVNARMPVYYADLYRVFNTVSTSIMAQPISASSFTRTHDEEGYKVKSKVSLQTMAIVGAVVLLMAWINYINLTVSRTARRMREVATRKISGAGSSDLLWQFIVEAGLTNIVAVCIAFTILQLARVPAATFLKVHISDWSSLDSSTIAAFALVTAFGVLLTGIYPAVIAGKSTVSSLFIYNAGQRQKILPSIITTLQYASAIALIFLAMVMHRQLNYIFNKDLGFERENVLLVQPPFQQGQDFMEQLEHLKAELRQDPVVKDVTQTSGILNLSVWRSQASAHVKLDGVVAQENFVSFFDHKLIAGRDFVKDDRNDILIITRYATERLGFEHFEEAVGSKIIVGDARREMEIVGVIENFRLHSFLNMDNTESSTGRGQALLYRQVDNVLPKSVVIQLDNSSAERAERMEAVYQKYFPGQPFTAFFFDDWINAKYTGEQALQNQITFFTLLAIGIACLGLLGMIANKVVERMREIGIRKALGAGISNIADILLRSTLRQMIVATTIGLLLSYHLSLLYLERYTDKIAYNALHFVVPVLLLITIMLVTISTVLLRVSRMDPVDALRHE
jgi:putative ABC transport system permease protein